MKKRILNGIVFRTVNLLIIAMIINSCDRNRNHPGWDYFPDMFYSTAYETYTMNPNFGDSMTMRTPVEGTVPLGYVPFEYTIDEGDRIRAGKELSNPIPSTPESLERGKEVYLLFCAMCHGITGKGDGHLYSSKLYPIKPRPLTGNTAEKLKDGEIFHSITLGFGSMGSHGSQVRYSDRWKVLSYIRKLQEDNKENNENEKEK